MSFISVCIFKRFLYIYLHKKKKCEINHSNYFCALRFNYIVQEFKLINNQIIFKTIILSIFYIIVYYTLFTKYQTVL